MVMRIRSEVLMQARLQCCIRAGRRVMDPYIAAPEILGGHWWDWSGAAGEGDHWEAHQRLVLQDQLALSCVAVLCCRYLRLVLLVWLSSFYYAKKQLAVELGFRLEVA